MEGDAPASPHRRTPGEAGIWFLVVGDLFVFSTFFATYLYYRAFDPLLFAESQAQLSSFFGIANTLILLTSSLFVAQAVNAIRQGRPRKSRRLFLAAILAGLLFVINKALEWGSKIDIGIYPTTNDFFMYYYMFTGIHLIHVIAGLVLLVLLYRDSSKASVARPASLQWMEVGATFWHLVDLLWIVIFALLYVVH